MTCEEKLATIRYIQDKLRYSREMLRYYFKDYRRTSAYHDDITYWIAEEKKYELKLNQLRFKYWIFV